MRCIDRSALIATLDLLIVSHQPIILSPLIPAHLRAMRMRIPNFYIHISSPILSTSLRPCLSPCLLARAPPRPALSSPPPDPPFARVRPNAYHPRSAMSTRKLSVSICTTHRPSHGYHPHPLTRTAGAQTRRANANTGHVQRPQPAARIDPERVLAHCPRAHEDALPSAQSRWH